jgi:cytosine/uracil/thiamine/allantoin permease
LERPEGARCHGHSKRIARALNDNLTPAVERKWGAFSIFNVWTSDVHSLWGSVMRQA